MEEELTTPEEIDDPHRIQFVLMAYTEIIANIPEKEQAQTNDQMLLFFQATEKLDRPGF